MTRGMENNMILSTTTNSSHTMEAHMLKINGHVGLVDLTVVKRISDEMFTILSKYHGKDVENDLPEYSDERIHTSLLKQLLNNVNDALARYCDVRKVYPVQFNSREDLANRQLYLAANTVLHAIRMLFEETHNEKI